MGRKLPYFMKQRIEIKEYVRKVKLSNKRVKKYYELGKTQPKAKKYQDRFKYQYRRVIGFGYREFLVDLETDQRVVANPKAAGTPKYVQINGQKIFNGEINKHTRNKVVKVLKDMYEPYIKTLTPITEYPLKLTLEIHDTPREPVETGSLFDLDNRVGPYLKALQDCLTDNGIIAEDNSICICDIYLKYRAVDTPSERKLCFELEKINDKEILEQQSFKKELNKWNIQNT